MAPISRTGGEARARAKHELLLQVPMEPFDYPDNDPGPRTLLTSLDAEQNVDRLHWLMSRFQGYVGLIGYMGAQVHRFRPRADAGLQRSRQARADLCRRRLLAAQRRRPDCRRAQPAFAKADIVLDAVPTPTEINHALARLEMVARDRGNAVGLPPRCRQRSKRIAAWAKEVEGKGFVLVPITAMALKAKPHQANRE